MDDGTRKKIHERIIEIDEYLDEMEQAETSWGGWLTGELNTADVEELAELYQERERLMQELAKAA